MTVEIWGKPACPYCVKAKQLCENMNIEYVYKQLGVDFDREQVFEQFPNARTFPQIIINSSAIGGYTQLVEYIENTNFNGTGYSL